jgi:putative transposase
MLRLLVGDEKRSRDFGRNLLYNSSMTLKHTSHAVYETKYHIVWCPKYRKQILLADIQKRVKEIFWIISEQYEFEIDKCEVAEDHVDMLISFPPRYSIAEAVGILKSKSGAIIFEEFPELKKKLWMGHIWEQGYFVRTVGEHITDDVIRKYIEKHSFSYKQLKFEGF